MELKKLTLENRRKIAVNILTDAIILDRVYYVTSELMRAASEKDGDGWNAIDDIHSYENAFHLYDIIEEPKVCEKLAAIYEDIFDTDQKKSQQRKRKDATLLAKLIVTEWEDYLGVIIKTKL